MFVLTLNTINGNITSEPLWFTYENSSARHSVLLAENLWKWRMFSFKENLNFVTFDSFLAKLIQYLDVKNKDNRLIVDFKSIYDGSEDLEITAQYFNKNYEPDSNANLVIRFQNKDTGLQTELPMIINNYSYSLNISDLESGKYSFVVNVNKKQQRFTGAFEILNFNIEQQFTNANIDQLELLSENTNTNVYFNSQINQLIEHLISEKRFYSVQKITKKSLYLLEINYWLLLLIISLTSEWLMRKYNGLI